MLQGKLAVRLGAHGHQKLARGFSGVGGKWVHDFLVDSGGVQRFEPGQRPDRGLGSLSENRRPFGMRAIYPD